MTIVYAFLLLAGFCVLCALMVWSICRQCAIAERELVLDELWADDDDLAVSA